MYFNNKKNQVYPDFCRTLYPVCVCVCSWLTCLPKLLHIWPADWDVRRRAMRLTLSNWYIGNCTVNSNCDYLLPASPLQCIWFTMPLSRHFTCLLQGYFLTFSFHVLLTANFWILTMTCLLFILLFGFKGISDVNLKVMD
jgi:hypothetical protein